MGIQNKKQRARFSQLRQSLSRLGQEVSQLIKPFFSDQPVVRGSVYELKRKCGKPGCSCARGQLHKRMVVSASEKGRTRLTVIPRGFLVEVQRKVERYRRLRRSRARLIEVHKNMLKAMDEMEALRREEMTPPERSHGSGSL